MSFPATPRDIIVELYVGGTWIDISEDVYQREPLEIRRGLVNEAARPQVSTCSMTLDNRSGNYTARNPLGAYFGALGRNTPIRVSLRATYDTFSRAVSSGWGSDDTGLAWSLFGTAGPLLSEWNVASGVGTHSVPAVAGYRASYLAAISQRDVEIAATVSLAISDVTGGDLEPVNLMLRGVTTSDYYLCRVVITPAEVVTVSFHHSTGGELVAPVTVTGLTHTSSQSIRVRAQAEGQTLRAKVWAAAGEEPFDWHVTVTDDTITSPGWVGIRSGVAAANTNALPIAFSYDDVHVTTPRFAGEVSSWPARRDVSGQDVYSPIEAGGLLRRLGTGDVLQSVLRRGVLSVNPVAYWPCEESSEATEISSGLSSGQPMGTVPETPSFASSDDFASSAPLPTFDSTAWFGTIPAYDTSTGQAQIRLLVSIPSGGAGVSEHVLRVWTSGGTTGFWDVNYATGSGGTLTLNIFDPNGVLLATSGAVGFNMDGNPCRLSLEMTQDGADIDWNLSTLDLSGAGGGVSGTLAGRTFSRVEWINVGGDQQFTNVGAGHITVQNQVTSIFELSDQLTAYVGEAAGTRLERLCTESGIALAIVGDATATTPMGAQRVDTLMTLIEECAEADLGALYEQRGTLGLAYRTRESVYSNAAVATLDFSNNELAPPFEPVDDDQLTRNDITAKRADGGEARVELGTGRMSTLDPSDGGAGRYSDTYTVNVESDSQLSDIAGWVVHLGTVDEARYPSVRIDFANARIAADSALSAALLDLDVRDRLVITNADNADIYDDISQLVLGYSEFLLPFQHQLEINCAPESPYQVLVTDAADSKLGAAGCTLNEDLDTTETAVDVAISTGNPLWTTVAGQMPIPITIGGEEMSVTAISGSSSPQTMAVTRSVNGVVKTHTAGAEVRLLRRSTLAL